MNEIQDKHDLICYFIGCLTDETTGHCLRCGRGYYDNQFAGVIWNPLRRFQDLLEYLSRFTPFHKCAECGKRILKFDPVERIFFCSKECQDNWIPF